MNSSLRVGVVGAGAMGRHHAVAVQRLAPRARVVAVVDEDASRARSLAKAVGAKGWYPSVEMLLAAEAPDVVHVCTPPASHANVACAALTGGAHVYVEKPFTTSLKEAREVLDLATHFGKRVCAGHQLLVAPPTRRADAILGAIGDVHHVESYFAFRPTRPTDGRTPRTAVEQLMDILPHPVYLLLHFMGGDTPETHIDQRELIVDDRGDVFATIKMQGVVGRLTVTLRGRPADSWVRIVGSRGTLHLDYIRDLLLPTLGTGSAIEKIFDPYRRAWGLAVGTTFGLTDRVIHRQTSYSGLRTMFQSFYDSVQNGGPPPTSAESILRTVAVCDRVSRALSPAHASESQLPPPTVAVTGGTGLLGRAVVRALVRHGVTPLVFARRLPAGSERTSGVRYAAADLGTEGSLEIPNTIGVVVHCAAETSGGWDAHQRNSVGATRILLDAIKRSHARRLVYVSSLAVVDAGAKQPIDERSPLEANGRERGPYVWGKLEAERIAAGAEATHGIAVKIVRPGALVDGGMFEPPGKLGRSIGGVYIAVGNRSSTIPICDLADAGRMLAWMAVHFDDAPPLVNLVDAEPATRAALVARVRRSRPGVRVGWIPAPVLAVLSLGATVAQKIRHPRRAAVSVRSAFAAPRCDTTIVRSVFQSMARDERLASAPVER